MQLGGICAYPSCHPDTPPGVKRCEEHAPKPWEGSTRAQRLPRNWRKIRGAVIARDGHRCVRCQRGTPMVRLEVDHITPGDNHNPSNLQTLCVECHKRKTYGWEDRKRRGGSGGSPPQ